MRPWLIKCGPLVVLLLWAFAVPARSATKPAVAPVAAQKSAEAPAVIAVTDVIPRSERALDRLRQIRQNLDADNSVSVVEAGLPAFAQQLDEWWKAQASTIKPFHSVQRINDVLWQARLYEEQIAAWNGLLATSSKAWSAEDETLDELLANWQATQLALKKAAPAAVRDKIIEVLREGEAARRLLQEKTGQLVAVQGKLAARLERLNEIHKEIEAVRQHSRVVRLALDSPPLWTLLSTAEATHSIAAQISESAAKFYKEAVNFFHIDQRRLLVHLVQFLVILGLFYRLRYLAHNAGDIKPTAAERFVLERSFSSALLVSLFTVPLFYVSPNILRIAMIPVVIPILRLLPAILSPRLRMGFYFLTVIYWLDLLHYYMPPQWLLVRLLILAAAVLGIVVMGLILKTWKSGPTASQHSAGAIRSLLHIAMALFVGAIIANVVGNLSLAELLVSPLVRILYVGVVIRMGAVTATTYAVMALRAPLALVLRTVRERGEAVALSLRRLVNFIAATLWILIGLLDVGALEDVQIALKDFLQLQWKVGAAEISVGDFAIFSLVLCAAYVISRLLRFVLAEEIFPRFQMSRGVPDVLELVARYGVLLFGFLLALTSAGVNLSQVTLAISALGVGIGFGLQNIVNNFVCGLILVFEHPIQVGDFVEVGSHFGKVQRIGFRASVVRTLDGAEVIVPNAELIGTKVINWSLSDRLRRVTVHVPVPIGTDPDRVIDILEAVGRSQSDVVSHPAPSAALEQFGDSSLKFELRCWTRCEGFGSVGNALTLAIDKAFQKEGIQIPFPQANVHVHWSDEITRGDRSTDTKK